MHGVLREELMIEVSVIRLFPFIVIFDYTELCIPPRVPLGIIILNFKLKVQNTLKLCMYIIQVRSLSAPVANA